MKKFLILFLSIAVFAACSSDDDGETQDRDPIVGSWVLVQASPPLDTQFCMDEQSTITFNENETGEATFYLAQMDCEPQTANGDWSSTGDSYSIELPVIGELNGTANFSGNDSFTFTTTLGVLTFERQ